MSKRVFLTVDLEPDCPPYLSSTFRGITEGAPVLLELFAQMGVPATYFATGEVAERYPACIEALVQQGHELGCHGHTHSAFDQVSPEQARWEIDHATGVLRQFAPVRSFRAPYLRFPDQYLGMLTDNDITLDSSLAKYKAAYYKSRHVPGILRIPASVTSSVLRLPALVRNAWLLALSDPVVLFVHPWEFVDLRHEQLRLDCRFRTGEMARQCLTDVIALFQGRGATFHLLQELAGC